MPAPAAILRQQRPSLWRAILDPAWRGDVAALGPDPAAAARRLGDLVTPALAGWLISRAPALAGLGLLDPAAVERSRLLNHFTGGVQRRWLRVLAESGIPFACLKGIVHAHTLYPDPDLRTIGDLDILVRDRDRDAMLDLLTGHGFAFEALGTSRWGFISEASFMPLVSDDGTCNIDLHVQPDCYPAWRALDAGRLFAAAREIDIDGIRVRAPSLEHGLLLGLTNAAKDKFGPFSVRKLVDVAILLQGDAALDWAEVGTLARTGHFAGPAGVAFALLAALGLPAGLVPDALRRPPQRLARRAFADLVADHAAMFERPPPARRVLARELLLCTESDVGLRNAWLRLRGLVRPASGIPAGYDSR